MVFEFGFAFEFGLCSGWVLFGVGFGLGCDVVRGFGGLGGGWMVLVRLLISGCVCL